MIHQVLSVIIIIIERKHTHTPFDIERPWCVYVEVVQMSFLFCSKRRQWSRWIESRSRLVGTPDHHRWTPAAPVTYQIRPCSDNDEKSKEMR